jgi:zinc transport system substrate-binding protein
MARINRAGLFVFTNRFMEPWAATLVNGIDTAKTGVVDASKGIDLADAKAVTAPGSTDADSHGHGHEKGTDGKDPHLWLDFSLASRMVDNILAGFVARDPKNGAYYTENAAQCRKRLAELDKRYRERLSVCRSRTMLIGGHDAFGYLARRYGIVSVAATGVSANAEPTPARMAELVRQVRTSGARAVFAEELVSPRLAETLAAETGAVVLRINAGHNVGRDDLARGVTFMGLMEENLDALSQGLGCSR